MAFTPTIKTQYPQPQGEFMEEVWGFLNDSGSTGGVITARYIKNIQSVTGNFLDESHTATTVTIVTDVNSSGDIIIRGL